MAFPLYSVGRSGNFSRRSFLATTSSLAVASLWSSRALGIVKKSVPFGDYPFQLGVASGDPTSSGVVLWTRLAPKPLDGGGMPDEAVEVSWQLAEDEAMTKVVQRGTVAATPEWGHSVHVEVDGLSPGRWYWYQFQAGGEVSPKGRTRTLLPAHMAPDKMRFAFASCQHFEAGYYTAYEHMSKDDLDLVVHLGDYIYEGPGRDSGIRKHVGPEIESLLDYRNRHAQYKTDAALQTMHGQVPWLVTWDDHEFDNNYAAQISEKPEVAAVDFLVRRAHAYQAYYEHMPLRRTSLPDGPDMQLYRRISFGNLADFFVLDTRQYRTDQPCGDKTTAPCEESYNPNATLLGEEQRNWLMQGLSNSSATWNIMAQQVMMARVDRAPDEDVSFSMDQWPGYEMDRRRMLKFLHERQIKNPVVLTGDIHSNWANELLLNFDDLDSRSVATEFVGTSISSGGDGNKKPKNGKKTLDENPFVKFFNTQRGYVRCEVTASQWKTDYQVVPYVTRPGAPVETRRSFVVEAGQPKLQDA